jgi:hypothetical protein
MYKIKLLPVFLEIFKRVCLEKRKWIVRLMHDIHTNYLEPSVGVSLARAATTTIEVEDPQSAHDASFRNLMCYTMRAGPRT